jgi:pyridoxamine 5'-phosphate oxidase
MNDLTSLRRDYSMSSLDTSDVNKNPIIQFNKWFSEAINAAVMEPNAMTLATVNEQGRPTSRVVLLKGVEQDQFVFYTNYQSRKGKELDHHAFCSLNFFWPELERQVRIEGTASRVSEEKSTQYFQSRPRGSQIGAWASPQSTPIASRALLEERVQRLEEKFKGQEMLPKPHQWGGYAITPFMIEFWQGRPSRLHDRILYTLVDGTWQIHRLAP